MVMRISPPIATAAPTIASAGADPPVITVYANGTTADMVATSGDTTVDDDRVIPP